MEFTLVKRLKSTQGVAFLYKCEYPFPADVYEETHDSGPEYVEYIIASSIKVEQSVYSVVETFLFPAYSDGTKLSWMELPGSYQGGCCQSKALEGFSTYLAAHYASLRD